MTMRLIYVAHSYGGLTVNLDRAEEWLTFLFREFAPDRMFLAPWIHCCRALSEEHRATGMQFDLLTIARMDELWMVGPHVSSGMKAEADEARRLGKAVINLTTITLIIDNKGRPPVDEYDRRIFRLATKTRVELATEWSG